MKKDTKIQIVTLLIFITVTAISVVSLKLIPNKTAAFCLYYVLQSAFTFILATYDTTWAFCSYASVGIFLSFILPFPSASVFILSVISNITAIAAIHLLYKTLKLGTLLTFAGAGFLRYVIAHFGIRLLGDTVTTQISEEINNLFGIPGLVSTLILVIIAILVLPAVHLAVKPNENGIKASEQNEHTEDQH